MPKKCYCGNEELSQYSDNYYVCHKCHTLISKVDFDSDLYEVQDEDNDLYGKNYWQKMMEEMTGQTSLDGVIDYYLKGRVVYWIKYMLKYIPVNSKVAEIGCGLGQLAYVMKMIGYNQMAYELSPDICQYIKQTLDINIHCGEFQTSDETYDAVLAFDLFEHLTQPEEFLTGVCERLSDDGILCLQMPSYDSNLTYEEMMEQKPRFAGHLTEFQHVFLYSKEAAEKLLKKVGFQEIIFEPACFGDDYDMFLFAGKKKLHPISDEEIENRFNDVNAGRILKALYHLYQENKELQTSFNDIEKDSLIRLENMEEMGKRLEIFEADSSQRLQKIEELEKRLEESESDRAARLEVIENCNEQIEKDQKQLVSCNKLIEEINAALKEKDILITEKNAQVSELAEQLEKTEESNRSMHRMLDLYLAEIDKRKQKLKFWK